MNLDQKWTVHWGQTGRSYFKVDGLLSNLMIEPSSLGNDCGCMCAQLGPSTFNLSKSGRSTTNKVDGLKADVDGSFTFVKWTGWSKQLKVDGHLRTLKVDTGPSTFIQISVQFGPYTFIVPSTLVYFYNSNDFFSRKMKMTERSEFSMRAHV